ncbi:O-antigen ligase family protein [Legionella sp. PATHC038]|uniref:O-antigen ligase family protein n=1 Tax=Legionella sheltonii TaxID=2992041 RepID=UPI002242E800|nr:O-antigen ligase family protein [Legionella sp. PATHC038]MCW8400158.1 O-antigen ligase family protein [Legionella sp. PATHC038]
MIRSFLEGKVNLIAPTFLVFLVFFIPISTSIKSILLILSLLALLLTPYYRQFLPYAFNTLWARSALVLFLFVLIACFWSQAPFSLQYNVIDKYSKLIFLPILAVGFVKPKTRLWVLNSYILVMLLTSILSCLKEIQLFAINTEDPGYIFYNHIVTGFMIALGVYFALILVLQNNKSGWMRFFYLPMIVVGSYQILFINTGRTGYVTYGILMSLVILQKFTPKKALLGMVIFLGAICLVYVLSPVMQDRTLSMINEIKLLQNNQANTSLGFRIQFHQYAQSLFEKHPILGVGTGGFQYNFVKDQPIPAWGHKLNEPHSQYWLTLSELGLVGMVLFLIFIGTLFTTMLQLNEMKPFLLGLLVSFCILSFSDTVFCYSTIGYLLILFSALSFGELIEKNEKGAVHTMLPFEIAPCTRDDVGSLS